MKESMMNKAKKFWAAHKYKIMGALTLAGIGAYAYCKYRQSQPSDEEIDKAVKDPLSELEKSGESDWDVLANDPKNQLANGGWVADQYGVCDDIEEFIVNDVPLTNIGTFGDDLIVRLKEQHPEYDSFELGSMIVDIYCNKGQEKKEEPAA